MDALSDLVEGHSCFGVVAAHNGISFDLPALGIDVLDAANRRGVLDTMVLDALVDPPDFGMQPSQAIRQKYALDAACRRYGIAGKVSDGGGGSFLKAAAKSHGGFGAIPTDDAGHLAYLRRDVFAAGELLERLVPLVADWDYVWREMRVHALMSVMSQSGILVDGGLLSERVAAAESRSAELIGWLVEEFNVPTTLPNGQPAKSPHASKAGKLALVEAFASVGVPPEGLPRTPTGQPSFSAEPLAELASRFPAAKDLCDAVAALVGVRSVYGTAARYVHVDGRVHPDVTMFQASGRASVTKPGMTVFGKRGGRVVERDVFVAAPGNVLLAADMSQVDARVVAAHSGDPEYARLFDAGKDAHTEIAYLVWGRSEVDANHKEYRDRVKAITHGTTYGMGIPKLSESTGIPEEEARRVVTTLREEFPGVEEWKREVRERAEAGEMLDNGFGRLMRVNPDRAYTQAPALVGQGGARDVILEGILDMDESVQRSLRTMVHDEIVVECKREDAAEVAEEVVRALSFEWCPPGKSEPVQFLAECSEPAERWSGCY